jgi:hypothetical protein
MDGFIVVVCFPSPYAVADLCMGGYHTDCPSVLGHFVIYIYIYIDHARRGRRIVVTRTRNKTLLLNNKTISSSLISLIIYR